MQPKKRLIKVSSSVTGTSSHYSGFDSFARFWNHAWTVYIYKGMGAWIYWTFIVPVLTHRWQNRSLQRHLKQPRPGQAMYGICHGGMDLTRRQASCDFLLERPFDGFAIGGSLGTCIDDCAKIVELCAPRLGNCPSLNAKPVHLLGIADEASISRFVPFGVDTFDSCFATRLARYVCTLLS